MMPGHPTGVVIATRSGCAEVSTCRMGACAGCSDAGACGISEAERREEVVLARNAVDARPGDWVELDLPGRAVLRLAALVWLIPAAGLLIGALTGAGLGRVGIGPDEDLVTLLGAAAGVALAWSLLRRIDRARGGDPRLTPFIVRICSRAGTR